MIKDKQKTRQQLAGELMEMHQRIAELEASEIKRKRAEEKLQKSEASLTEAQRIAHLGNWDWDIVTNELVWSDEIYDIFGLTPPEFGATYEAFLNSVHPDDREFVQKSTDEALYEGRPYSIEHRIVRPGDSERIVHQQGEVIFDEGGKPIRMVGAVQDITEHQRTERKIVEYEELSRLKNNLLSTVSHELRTPLAVIKGYCTMLLDYDRRLKRSEKEQCLESIDKATDRLTELVDHLLDMSRLEAGLLRLNKRSTSILKLMEEVVTEAKVRASSHKIVTDLAKSLPKTESSVNISVELGLIWPANHKKVMVDVFVNGLASDRLSGLNSFQLSMKDDYGRVEPLTGLLFQRKIQLEAWRDGRDPDGRVYTISITATDCAGNTATAETTVIVPRDHRRR